MITSDVLIQTSNGLKTIASLSTNDFILFSKGANKLDYKSTSFINHIDVVDYPIIEIKTLKGYSIKSTYDHLLFADFEKIPEGERYFVYLMYREDLGYRIGFTRLCRSGRDRSNIYGFKGRINQELGDALWILGAYESEKEARYFEYFYSITYGIPTWTFESKNYHVFYDSYYISKLFKNVDTNIRVTKLFKELGLFKDYPHHVPKCMTIKRRRNFNITLCGDSRNNITMHKYSMAGSDMDDAYKLKSLGISVRPSNKCKGYRIESSCGDLQKIIDIKDKVKSVMNINLIFSGKFIDRSLQVIPSSHLITGMILCVYDNRCVMKDTIIELNKINYTGTLYNIEINNHHNYIGNNILSYDQSIFNSFVSL